ncbi:MAG: hypothetical protein Q8918_02630 [Bacteroidota bacterium]|nr:hypothetical protein [Bacteroidota bacterium]
MIINLAGAELIQAQDLQNLKNSKPFTLHGNISAGLNTYSNFTNPKDSVSNTSFGSNPAYFLQANPVVSIYGYNIPINFMIASQNKSFNTPFNRFGLSPQYKWIKLHLGWQSLNFSQFTLSGQQMLGAGFELTPGKFRAAFMYGKFNNAVTDISQFNNLNNNIPLYKRSGFAAKIGYGSVANFIEFSYLQAKDDSNSIPRAIIDSVLVKPAANQVAGLNGQLTLLKSLVVKAEMAASYYVGNTSGDSLQTDNNWTKLAAFTPRTSSRISFAGQASLNYQFHAGNVNFQYRRVDPNYQSMGAFYMQTDIEQYTFGFNYGFLKNKLHLQSNIGWQKNNLANTAVSDSKRTIGNIGLNYSPSSAFGIDVNYSNYGISQQIIPQYTDPTALVRYDSVRISEVNQSISVSPHVFINGDNIQHSISLQADFQLLHNNNPAQSDEDFTSSMSSLIYSLIFPKAKFNISNTFNYFNTILTGNSSATLGYNLGVSKNLSPDMKSADRKKLIQSVNLSLYGGYFSSSFHHTNTGNTISVNPAISLGLRGKHTLQLNLNYTNMSTSSSNTSHQQLMFSTRYNVTF